MRITHRYMSSLLLAAALAAPVSIMAAARPQTSVQVRVYDKNHKDYHNWDDHENQAWGSYRSNNHKKPQEYSKTSKKEQGQYWNYRHSHPDRN